MTELGEGSVYVLKKKYFLLKKIEISIKNDAFLNAFS